MRGSKNCRNPPVSPNDSDTESVDTIPYDNEMEDDIVDDINESVETTPYDEMEDDIEREVYITKSGRKSKRRVIMDL